MTTRAVDRANALLTLVVESSEPRTFTSLVDELGLAKSTTSRLLHALERSRLVQRDRSGAFRPGALFSVYAARPNALHDLAELARPTLERLGELSEETVNISVPRGSEVVQIDAGGQPLRRRRDQLGRRRRARALHGGGQGARGLPRAGAAHRRSGAPHRALPC